jgi:hypothetical protein
MGTYGAVRACTIVCGCARLPLQRASARLLAWLFSLLKEKFVATASPVVETVSRKRVVSAAELAQEKPARTTPDFWEFIEKMTPEMWGNDFTLYILREDPKPSLYGGTNTLEKCPGYIAMPDGTKQPLSSREDIELAIKQKYGGKAFRLILKRANGERICEGKCVNEAPPRFPDANPQQFPLPNANGGMQSSDNIAVKAMDTIANQNPALINIAIDAVSRAAEIVSRHTAQPVAAAPSTDSDLDRAFKQAMIQKLLAPPPDPVETFLRIKAALGDGGGGASLAGNPLMDRVLTAAVEKILNPAPAVSGRTTLLDLGREFIPVLGTTVRETMHEYRLSVEANARIAEMQRGMPPPSNMNGAQPQAVQQLPPAAIAAPQSGQNPPPVESAAAPAAVPAPALTFPQIEAHIAKIVGNAEYPIDEAVDRVLTFLYDTDPRLVAALLNPPSIDQRLKPGKEGLLQLFTYEPALNVCMRNVPRVSEFIDKFLIAAKEAEEIEAKLRAAVPGAAAPAAPQPAPAS